ncbi:MAG: cysteine desulfurase, partial [Clostridiales bacterium]|nr:cysteine desulfurase [Clostridiales bacterium]
MPGRIYLDHSATTPLLPQVVGEMSDFLANHFGNPSSIHSYGKDARKYLEIARQNVAQLVNVPPDTIYFTGSGTEANNIAILGLARSLGRGHIITSAAEHPASLRACEHLLKEGFDLTVVEVDEQGAVHPETVHKALRKDTILVSIMLANNEVGSINPIREITGMLFGSQAFLHVDAIQAAGKIRVDAEDLGCDLLSLSAHKINGPKGVGALYKRREIPLEGLIHGGGQEQRLRSGTENMPGIWGMGVAARLAAKNWQRNAANWQKLRDHFIGRVLQEVPRSYLNGHPDRRLPHNANFSFDNIEGE